MRTHERHHPIHAPRFQSLHWHLTRTHVLLTSLVLLVLQALMVLLLSLYLHMHGSPWAAIGQLLGDALPGLLLGSALLVLVVGSLTAYLFGQLMSRSLRRRIQHLATVSHAFAAGDLTQRVHDLHQDELGQLAQHVNAMAQQLAETMQALPRLAALEERQRLAHDLHDTVTQRLFSLTLLLAAARMSNPALQEPLASQLAGMEATLDETLQEARRLIFALHPRLPLRTDDLATSLQMLVSSAAERQGLTIDLQIRQTLLVPTQTTQILLLIVHEALANVLRHSGTRAAQMCVDGTPQQLVLTIQDAGQGFAMQHPQAWTALGLALMRERAAMLHGHCQIQSAPGQGTQIQVVVPLSPHQENRS